MPEEKDRDEDSGLHDIRNLAQSTKQRLSNSKRASVHPPISDNDALASSSGSWKNIALPQPAKMVSLPELAELPTKHEVVAAEKAAKRSKRDSHDLGVAASAASFSAAEAPIVSLESRSSFSLPSQQNKRGKGPILAILGLGVAAAAGGVIYMQMNNASSDKTVAAVSSADSARAAAPATTTAQAEGAAGSAAVAAPAVEAAPPPPAEPEAKSDTATGAAASEAADTTPTKETSKSSHKASKPSGKKGSVTTVEEKDEPKEVKAPEKVEPKKVETPNPKKKGDGGEGEPSFDALLKEAGVDDKKEVKPKLEKKSLSGDDFKKGMGAVAAKAQACYKGTQGTASVKLTVAPSGSITKVTIGGQFAGTPEAKCVEAAVKSASFPAWDGGPQSFNYSYMLSD